MGKARYRFTAPLMKRTRLLDQLRHLRSFQVSPLSFGLEGWQAISLRNECSVAIHSEYQTFERLQALERSQRKAASSRRPVIWPERGAAAPPQGRFEPKLIDAAPRTSVRSHNTPSASLTPSALWQAPLATKELIAHVAIVRYKSLTVLCSEEPLNRLHRTSVSRSRNFKIPMCLYLYAFLAQQVTYIVSSLFSGRFATEHVFGNAGQLALNAVFLSAFLYGAFLLIRYLFERFSGRSANDVILLAGLLLVIPLIVFSFAVRPASVPYNLNYRGCAVRVGGELTSCGFWSAASDLFAMLLVAALVVMVFHALKTTGELKGKPPLEPPQ